MSLRLTLTNLILRHVVRRVQIGKLRPMLVRHYLNAMARLVRLRPGITLTPVAADTTKGLCPAEWLSVDNPERTVLYFHGGGYFFGSLITHRPSCAQLARHTRARVLSVDYRLAPEHPCPAAVDDAVAWWKELLRQGVNPAEVVFAGDSAGAALAVSCLVQAKAQGLPMPAGALLYSPMADMSCSGESMVSNARSELMFSPHMVPQAANLYLAGRPATDPMASPIFADLRGLPELHIFASESEILLSDSTRLHDKARQSGVKSTLITRPGMPHVWPIMIHLPEAQADMALSAKFMARVTGTLPRAQAA
jgi:epsilon-lactone hydrolase